jgi:hypothetical protein
MKTGLVAAVISLLIFAGVCQAEELAEWQTKTLDLVKLKHGVINARWGSVEKNALWISMDPGRYHAESFSQFVCEVLGVVGAPSGTVTSVSVFDPPSYSKSGWPMGTAECH